MKGKTVIIIDQSQFMRATIKILLWRSGCDIYEADDETKAVTLSVNKKPHLILMSLGFAKRDMMKFVKILKNIHRCPVIVYANSFSRDDVIKGFSASVDDILINPLQQKERLGRYFIKPPAEVRREYLNKGKEIEFNQARGRDRLEQPFREGGLMKWEHKAS